MFQKVLLDSILVDTCVGQLMFITAKQPRKAKVKKEWKYLAVKVNWVENHFTKLRWFNFMRHDLKQEHSSQRIPLKEFLPNNSSQKIPSKKFLPKKFLPKNFSQKIRQKISSQKSSQKLPKTSKKVIKIFQAILQKKF